MTIEVRARAALPRGENSASLTVETPNGTVLASDSVTNELTTHRFTIANVSAPSLRLTGTASDGATLFVRNVRVSVDSDGNGLSDTVEQSHKVAGNGRQVETHYQVADTDGDGLDDADELGEFISFDHIQRHYVFPVPTYGATGYYRINSYPSLDDSDGDGLTDFEEREGWDIQYTRNSFATHLLLQYLSGVNETSEIDPPEELLYVETVTSNPQIKDTSNNGLSDFKERQLGTDPRSKDTTGDGIKDARAVETGSDPTLYDVKPPEVEVPYWWWNKPGLSWETYYELQFHAEDAAGLDYGIVYLDGNQQTYHELRGESDIANTEFTTGVVDTVLDTYSGTDVTVKVVDSNGNTARVLAMHRHDIFAEVSVKLAKEGIIGRQQTTQLGMLSGFSTGAVETVEMMRGFLGDPVGYVGAIGEVIAQIDNLDKIIKELPASVEAQQKKNNPHEEGTDAYQAYRRGWYKGYIGYMVLEAAVPAGELGQAAASSSKLQNAVKTLDKTGHLTTAAKYTAKAAEKANAPLRYANYQLSQRLVASKGLASDGARRLLAGAKTTGQKIRQAQLVEMLDRKQLQRLSPDEQRAVGSILADGGGKVGRAMADGGPDMFARLHRIGGDIDGVNSAALASAAGRAMSEGVDMSRIERLVDDLDTLQRADVDGLDGLATRLSTEGSIDNFKNLAYEAEVAATLQRQGDDVARVSKKVKTTDGRTEIDIQLESGSTIEVKNGKLELTRGSKKQLERQLQHRKENGLSGNHYVKVSGEIGDDMRTYMDKNNIRVLDGSTLSGTGITTLPNQLTPESRMIGNIAV